ncbi:RNA-directed DNA polymerase, eukaryota, reverse transcriptase zinc-binding domain protein [Tanacetum coccineum]
MESIRSYFFRGVDLNDRKISLVKLDHVPVSKEKGDLAIHGEDGKLNYSPTTSFSSNWNDIVREIFILRDKGMDLLGLIKKKNRIYALETAKSISVAAKITQPGLVSSLRRMPRKLTVASVRNFDDHSFADSAPKIRWIKAVQKKINIHAWRIKMDNLPTRFNLARRGIDLDSIICPNCNMAAETSIHIFFHCPMAKDIYKRITNWWDINILVASSYEEWCAWFTSLCIPVKLKTYLEGVFYTTWWMIWIFHNKTIFGSSPQSKDRIVDDIVARSFSWCRFRCNSNFSWVDWLKNPSIISL